MYWLKAIMTIDPIVLARQDCPCCLLICHVWDTIITIENGQVNNEGAIAFVSRYRHNRTSATVRMVGVFSSLGRSGKECTALLTKISNSRPRKSLLLVCTSSNRCPCQLFHGLGQGQVTVLLNKNQILKSKFTNLIFGIIMTTTQFLV